MKPMHNSPSWTSYTDILADEFGITFTCEPRETWEDIRGHRVRMDTWLPTGEPRGTLILVHGGGGHGRVLAPFAIPAVAHGWRVLAPDLPGYGLTEPAPSFDWAYAEWPAIIADLADASDGPVVLMGLSLGGMTAVAAAQIARSVDGVIATTLIDAAEPELFIHAARWPWLGRLTLFAISHLPWLVDRLWMPLSLATPLAAMSSRPRMQQYFCRDELLGGRWVAAKFFRKVHQFRLPEGDLPCPLTLVHPGADNWTPLELSLPAFERINAPDKRLVNLSNGAHLPVEQPAFDELAEAVTAALDRIADTSAASPRSLLHHG